VRTLALLIALTACAYQTTQTARAPAAAVIREISHESQVLGDTRTCRAILPPAYANSQKRYPVIYWLHGYEQGDDEREAIIAGYVASHDVIVINSGPVETTGGYPLYFPELVDQVDHSLRTLANRDQRAVSGFASGGFMAFWVAGKYPDLVSSASSFMGNTAASVGPRDLDLEYNLDDVYGNYDGVRTRLITAERDFRQFYHQRLNSIWLYARTGHETEAFDPGNVAAGVAKTLDFHMHAFATPLPKPASFSHADVYPNFGVWGWEVVSDRKEPGFTALENVSRTGFRSVVREWVPGGSVIARTKLNITSPPLYPPGSPRGVTYVRLRDKAVRRVTMKADARGRLSFDLDGDAYEVGISAEPVLTMTECEPAEAAWATAGGPVKLRARFLNKGQARSATSVIQWSSPDPSVKFEPATTRLFGLAPAESGEVSVTATVPDPARRVLKVVAAEGANRMTFTLPLFPSAPPVKDMHITDGQTMEIYQHAVATAEVTLGEGNQDGQAAPGERFAVLLPDGTAMRAAELFTNDPCVDTGVRGLDSWNVYDHAGVSAVYSLPLIRPDCAPGHIVHALARVLVPNAPNHRVRYAAIEFPVWYRSAGAPGK
jgi:S-formylglutathione hydrolase FrmB